MQDKTLLKRINLQNSIKVSLLEKEIAKRKNIFSPEMLARSLSSIASFPMGIDFLRGEKIKKISFVQDLHGLKGINTDIIATDASHDELSMIKRYGNKPVLQIGHFIDEYQILESLVFGADFLLFSNTKPSSDLATIAKQIGLVAIMHAQTPSDLQYAIEYGFEGALFSYPITDLVLPDEFIGIARATNTPNIQDFNCFY